MGKQVFFDIDIGDSDSHTAEQARYDATVQFFKRNRSRLGIPADATLDALDAEACELVTESFQSRGTSEGEPRFQAPAPLCAGRVTIELFREAPKATENFRCLCTGERGKGKKSGRPLHYQGTCFHRIVTGFVCQGGDVAKGDGSGGDSIYGGPFKPEKPALKLKHDDVGVVSMASSNESQFFITLAPAPQCDHKHVVLGKVVSGLDILKRIDAEAASADGAPRVPVRISACGEC